MTTANRLFLIDGHALVFKMYYALLRHPMINSKGEDTSILYGFTRYILELIEKEAPTHFAVAFDPPGKTFRHEMYPAYKGTRSATPQLVIDALEPLTEICRSMRMPVLMKPGFEADDVIGSMAKRAEREGFEVFMVTPDKDYGQLISSHITQFKPGKSGTDNEMVGPAEVCAKYGISRPEQVIDMLAICGDTSDNVPGVRGVGEVGAAKLIAKYGSVEEIYAHQGELSPKQAALFEEAKGHIRLSHELVTIKTDIDLSDITTESMALSPVWDARAAELFELHEFGSLRRFLSGKVGAAVIEAADTTEELAYRSTTVDEVLKAALACGEISLTYDKDGDSVLSPASRITAAANGDGGILTSCGKPLEFRKVLEDESVVKSGYDTKGLYNALKAVGIELKGHLLDIELLHYIISPEKSHKLEQLSKSYLNVNAEEHGSGEGSEKKPAAEPDLFAGIGDECEEELKSRERETAICLALAPEVLKELKGTGMADIYYKIEEPLVRVLGDMERTGVKVDVKELGRFADGLRVELSELEARLRETAGNPSFNPSSPRQVGALIFDQLDLDPRQKKSASGSYPTDEETLAALSDRHPVIEDILEYRAVKKLLGTYIEPFPGYIEKDGRIHTTFNQALTSTGRLSSSKPNLQNIPIRTERGKEIRKAFVPETPGAVIVSADYSQIELRIMAHLSADSHLIEAFCSGQDVHKATAAKIFDKPVEEVTSEERRVAKTANFGIMYGISAFGLSQRLHNSRSEAKKIIEDYFASFPSISAYIEDTLSRARENLYVETLFGRRRYIPDINARNANVRSLAERNAVNAPIQGTSADIIKIAMARVAGRLSAEGLRSRMILQIHDELLFEALPEELEPLKRIITEEMEHVVELSIPLTVECNDGANWLEAH